MEIKANFLEEQVWGFLGMPLIIYCDLENQELLASALDLSQ